MEIQTCSNPDCQIAENGSCHQGHDPVQSCPNFGKLIADPDPSEEADAVIDQAADELTLTMARLPSGQPYELQDVDTFLLQKPAQLVAIVGDTSSGKSTLLCSIYDRFLRGTFAGRTFAGSNTLIAFEEVAHYSRAASGASVPDTPRTSLSEGLQFYHLSTASENSTGDRLDLFMSDRAGETYLAGLDRPDELRDLQELRLARTVAILVDGARLVIPEEQHEVLDTARQLVRAMIDSETLTSGQHLQLILTKRDEVERSGDADALVARVKAVVTRIAEDFGGALASVNFFEIAARDPSTSFEVAYGCDVLLQSWLNAPKPQLQPVNPTKQIEVQFDQLSMNLRYGVER